MTGDELVVPPAHEPDRGGGLRELVRQIDDGTLPDARRRDWLRTAVGTAGGVGLLAAAYPFVASMEPSERAKALGGQLP